MDQQAIDDNRLEIEDIIKAVTSELTQLKKSKKTTPQLKRDRIAYFNSRVKRCRDVLKGIKVELRELPKVEAKPFLEQAAQLEEKINGMQNDIDWWERDDTGVDPNLAAEATTYTGVLKKAEDIQNEDLKAVDRMIQKTEETERLGADTLVTMQQQREQLQRIDAGIDEVSSNIKLAQRHMRTLVRRLATDKIILGFIFLIFVGVIFIIVWSATHKNAKLTHITIPSSTTATTTSTTTG